MEVLLLNFLEMGGDDAVERDADGLPRAWPLLKVGDNVVTRSEGMPLNLRLTHADGRRKYLPPHTDRYGETHGHRKSCVCGTTWRGDRSVLIRTYPYSSVPAIPALRYAAA